MPGVSTQTGWLDRWEATAAEQAEVVECNPPKPGVRQEARGMLLLGREGDEEAVRQLIAASRVTGGKVGRGSWFVYILLNLLLLLYIHLNVPFYTLFTICHMYSIFSINSNFIKNKG